MEVSKLINNYLRYFVFLWWRNSCRNIDRNLYKPLSSKSFLTLLIYGTFPINNENANDALKRGYLSRAPVKQAPTRMLCVI